MSTPENKTTEKPRYLTCIQLSALLKISLPTVHRWIGVGLVPAIRAGRKFLIPIHDVELLFDIMIPELPIEALPPSNAMASYVRRKFQALNIKPTMPENRGP